MIYLFILNLILVAVLIYREVANTKERQDLILHIKSKDSTEFAEAKMELKQKAGEDEEEHEEEVPVGDLETDKFQELINK